MKHSFKKRCMVIAAAVLMVIPGTTVFARGRDALRNDRSCQNVCTFIDEDKNDICDNCSSENCRNQLAIQQDTSEQTSSGQASFERHPHMGCRGQRQGRNQGRGRR